MKRVIPFFVNVIFALELATFSALAIGVQRG